MPTTPTLAEAANTLAAILGSILRMSDDVKNAASPLDTQGKLLRMQKSIQQNGARVAPYIKVVLDAVEAERATAVPDIPCVISPDTFSKLQALVTAWLKTRTEDELAQIEREIANGTFDPFRSRLPVQDIKALPR
jgi:hypothetical protein